MNWSNLKNKRCPKCGSSLKFSYGQLLYYCPNNQIGNPCFMIKLGKFKKLIPKQEKLNFK